MYPELIENIMNDMYVNDLVLGKNILSNIEEIKQNSKELFDKDELHKWHWDISLLKKTD